MFNRRLRTFSCVLMSAALLFGLCGCGDDNDDAPSRTLKGGAIQGVPLNLTKSVSTLAGTAGTYGHLDGTGAAASFSEPYGITTDGTNLYITEKSSSWDGVQSHFYVSKIVIATGVVTTLVKADYGATGLAEPVGLTTDGTHLYVCDSENDAIKKIALSDGTMTLLAGGTVGFADGTGAAAQFNDPYGVTVVGDHLYVADRRNNTIRKIEKTTGVVTTIAGQAGVAGFANNAVGTSATFDHPMSITTDGTNLYIGDWNNFAIRKIVLATGAVTTLAGTGTVGAVNAIGTAASFYGPRGLTTDGTSLYVADFYMQHSGISLPGEPPEGSSLIRKINLATADVTTIAGRTLADEVQTITLGAGVTNGTFTLTFNGETTAAINYNASTIDVQNALSALPSITNWAVVTGAPGAWIVTFRWGLGFTDVPQLTADSTGLTGGTAVVSTTTQGVPTYEDNASGILSSFEQPSGITTDGYSLFVTDRMSNTIREIK